MVNANHCKLSANYYHVCPESVSTLTIGPYPSHDHLPVQRNAEQHTSAKTYERNQTRPSSGTVAAALLTKHHSVCFAVTYLPRPRRIADLHPDLRSYTPRSWTEQHDQHTLMMPRRIVQSA